MTRSRKRFPGGTWCCCKSQKRGKQVSNRRFRRKEHQLIHQEDYHRLPLNPMELTSPWDLGGDGKHEWFCPLEEQGEAYRRWMSK